MASFSVSPLPHLSLLCFIPVAALLALFFVPYSVIYNAELSSSKPVPAKLTLLQDLHECLHRIKKLKVMGL